MNTCRPPLSILHIGSFVREHGHPPFVLHLPARKWTLAPAVAFVEETNPWAVGISAETVNIGNAAELATRSKCDGIDGPIVPGGAHVTAVPSETPTRFHAFDIEVLGEGELTFLELLTRRYRLTRPDLIRRRVPQRLHRLLGHRRDHRPVQTELLCPGHVLAHLTPCLNPIPTMADTVAAKPPDCLRFLEFMSASRRAPDQPGGDPYPAS